jgi:thiol-disulfide isomerase/thioredoxin
VKYSFLSLLFVSLSSVIFGQSSVSIKGLIKKSSADSIFISYNNSRLIYEPVEFKERLDEGRFSYTFKVKEKYTPVLIQHGKQVTELMVQPGDELDLIANVTDSGWTLNYTGIGSERANFLAKHGKDMGLVERYMLKMQRSLTREPAEFVKKMEEEEEKELEYLQKNRAGLPVEFVRYLEASFRYFTYFCRLQYPYMHEVAINKSTNFPKIPEKNYATVKNLPAAFNDSFICLVPYRLYSDHYYRMQMELGGYFNDTTDVFRVQDSIARLALKNMPPETAEYVIALHLYAAVRTIPLDTAAVKIEAFKKRWPGSMYKPNLESQYAIAKRLAPGEKAYDFTFTTPQGKTGKLSDLKGKIVLLGFWSSQYRQCILELKAAAQMANKYKDKELVFLYVSLDTDEFPWIMAIEEHKLQGIHTREEGSWKSLLAQMYGIQALPTFFLVDKDGRFVLKRTPNPSQAAFMVKEVDKLLN